ncbi:SSI family serine proteinase inhibitor [Streptomyces megasporus]|uniref:SSI family serine proteinase inhibitor n=1 Tax=Streptomyces megasporus TaxID=44060 RepID=UPI0004E1A743|nr:SSI family serine proteinase inhibitor [Streptomyces megasporus]
MFPRPRATAAAAVAALLALVPTSAARVGATEPPRPHGELFLTVSDADGTWTRGVRLVCPDQGGPHPRADEACAALDRTQGEFRTLSDGTGHCTMEHAPVIATASGTWRDGRITWEGRYPNACDLARRTGAVFDF